MNNQDDLQDGVDPKLKALYRQLPKEQPSAELDEKILAAAKITTPNQNQRKPRHWQAPFALAASVVMVSSVALYLHEENHAVFEVQPKSVQAPTPNIAMPATNIISEPSTAAEMAKQALNDATDIANTKPLSAKKVKPQKAKDAQTALSEESQTASLDSFNNANGLTALDEKKTDMTSRADQMAEAALANKSARSVQYSAAAKEQEVRQAKAETDKLAVAAPAPLAYAPAPASAPPPAPQMQTRPELTELRSWQAGHLQDSNRANKKISATSTESDHPVEFEKSKAAPTLAAAPLAATPMNLGATAGSARPMARQLEMQRAKRDEATTSADYAHNISAPILSIEGVAMGMSREQLVTLGLTCYVDVCHLDLSQPQQATYWGIPSQNAHLTAFISHHIVTKLLLQQKNARLNTVKTALSNIGIVSQQSCIEEKGTLLIGRQLGANTFNVRSMGVGLSLAICQQTKSFNKP